MDRQNALHSLYERREYNTNWFGLFQLSSKNAVELKKKHRPIGRTNYNIEYCLLYSLPQFMVLSIMFMGSHSLTRMPMSASLAVPKWHARFFYYAKWIQITNGRINKPTQRDFFPLLLSRQRRTIANSIHSTHTTTSYYIFICARTKLLLIGSCPFLV